MDLAWTHRGQVPFLQFSQLHTIWAVTLDTVVQSFPLTTNSLLALLVFMMDGVTFFLPPCSWLGRFVVEDRSICRFSQLFNCTCRPAPSIGWDVPAIRQVPCCFSWPEPDIFWGFGDGWDWDCVVEVHSIVTSSLSTQIAWPGDESVVEFVLFIWEGLKSLRAAPLLLGQKRPANLTSISFSRGTFSARWLERDSGRTREKNRRSLSMGSFCAMSSSSVVRSVHLVEARYTRAIRFPSLMDCKNKENWQRKWNYIIKSTLDIVYTRIQWNLWIMDTPGPR